MAQSPTASLKQRRMELRMDDEELAKTAAEILGSSSAASKALAELNQRRSAGEAVSIWQFQKRWIVGPTSLVDGPKPQEVPRG